MRYARAVRRDPSRRNSPDVLEALEIRLGFLVLGGAYPERDRRLSQSQREAVFARDERRCYVCGGEATQIDHLSGSVEGDPNHPDNLRAICNACHREKTRAAFISISRETEPELWGRIDAEVKQLDRRIQARKPIRECDDQANWQSCWRQVAAERTRALARMPVLNPDGGPFGPMCTPSGRQWVVAEYDGRGLDEAGGGNVHVLDFGKFKSFDEAQHAADDWASDVGRGAFGTVEDLLLARGVLPGEDPALEQALLIELDQPDTNVFL